MSIVMSSLMIKKWKPIALLCEMYFISWFIKIRKI
jgi:hypothetical protein